jgi:transcriptional regulator with XRE-family HTH domain
MGTIGVSTVYGDRLSRYNSAVPAHFTIGDVIRRAREAKNWNQTRLGKEAAKFQLEASATATPIDKSTVSKVETDPYTSELETVWRLVSALGLTLSDVERRMGDTPFHVLDAPLERRTAAKHRRAG